MVLKSLSLITIFWLLTFHGLFAKEIKYSDFIYKTEKSIEKVTGAESTLMDARIDILSTSVLAEKNITITGFEIGNKTYNLVLERKRPVIDANSIIFTQGKTGAIPASIPELISFAGTIQGQPDSYASMVIINNKLYLGIRLDINYYSLKPEKQFAPDNADKYILSPVSFDEFICENGETRDIYENIKLSENFVQSDELLECELALETDTEFYKANSSDSNKTKEYAILLVQMLSNLYEKEVNVIFYLTWYHFWTDNPLDPYNAKGNPSVLAPKAMFYWNNNYKDVHRDVAHVMTTVSYGGGGSGSYDALCSNAIEHSMSFSSVQCGHSYPRTDFTYDIYILAHEIGHNFNARHTHSCFWNPPIDTCVVAEGIEDGCFSTKQEPKPNPGSIMSYCGSVNKVNYGIYEVKMVFDPQNKSLIRKTAEAAPCLEAPAHSSLLLIRNYCNEVLAAGNIYPLNWISQRVQNVNIDYSTDKGKTWVTVESNYPASNSAYNFVVPNICNTEVYLKISNREDNSVNSVMKGFSVSSIDQEGLTAFYPFNNSNKDMQECGMFDLSEVGEVRATYDRFGSAYKAAYFDGKSYLKSPRFINNLQQFTVSLWFRADSTNPSGYLICQDWEQSTYLSVLVWNSNIGAALKNSDDFKQMWYGKIDPDKWQHCAITYDGNIGRLYHNGILRRTVENVGKLPVACSPFYVGSRNGKESFKGAIDDIMIFNRALNGVEVMGLFNKPVSVEDNVEYGSLTLELSPMPPVNILNARFNKITTGNGVFSIYMPDGRRLLSTLFNSGEQFYTVDVAALNSGIYFYTYTAGTDIITGQFVICR